VQPPSATVVPRQWSPARPVGFGPRRSTTPARWRRSPATAPCSTCGFDTRRDPQERWLDSVKRRLRDDLDSCHTDAEGFHDEIEEWDFEGSRIVAAVGSFDDDSNR
jgi:ribosomal protein L37E